MISATRTRDQFQTYKRTQKILWIGCSTICNFKMATGWIFTPLKLANTANQGFSFIWDLVYQHIVGWDFFRKSCRIKSILNNIFKAIPLTTLMLENRTHACLKSNHDMPRFYCIKLYFMEYNLIQRQSNPYNICMHDSPLYPERDFPLKAYHEPNHTLMSIHGWTFFFSP